MAKFEIIAGEKMNRIYLDYHATTPMAAEVQQAMLAWMGQDKFGNAHASHEFGRQAADAVEQARKQVADALGCKRHELLWTAGATEAANIALRGVLPYLKKQGRHKIISFVGEHAAVANNLTHMTQHNIDGFQPELRFAPMMPDGRIDMAQLTQMMDEQVGLVAIMHSHNEIGTVQDMAQICQIAHQYGALVFSDMTQSFGKMPVDLSQLPVDMACFSAHKLYGPMGIGALFSRDMKYLTAQQFGGGQEKGLRSGTVPVFLTVGFGTAASLAQDNLSAEMAQTAKLRDRLMHGVQSILPNIIINGSLSHRLPGNLHLSFADFTNQMLHATLPELQFSSGSACSFAQGVSSLLQSLPPFCEDIKGTAHYGHMRLCVGRFTSQADIDATLNLMQDRLVST